MARCPVLVGMANTLSLHPGIGTTARRHQGLRRLPSLSSLTSLQCPTSLQCLTQRQPRAGPRSRDPHPPPATKGHVSLNTPEPRPSPKRLRPQLQVRSRRAPFLRGSGSETTSWLTLASPSSAHRNYWRAQGPSSLRQAQLFPIPALLCLCTRRQRQVPGLRGPHQDKAARLPFCALRRLPALGRA